VFVSSSLLSPLLFSLGIGRGGEMGEIQPIGPAWFGMRPLSHGTTSGTCEFSSATA
jgi:hypothetical protein